MNWLQNCPSSFWKDFILKPYLERDGREPYVMSNENRRIFNERILSLSPTHDMKRPVCPTKAMKGELSTFVEIKVEANSPSFLLSFLFLFS